MLLVSITKIYSLLLNNALLKEYFYVILYKLENKPRYIPFQKVRKGIYQCCKYKNWGDKDRDIIFTIVNRVRPMPYARLRNAVQRGTILLGEGTVQSKLLDL